MGKKLEFSYKLILALTMSSEEVIEEVEALSAILEEDTVDVVREEDGERLKEVVVKILPLTEGEQEKQYVSLNLVVTLTEDYPSSPPTLGVRNPRGLDEAAVAGLLADMNTRCEEYCGCPVLFELIEMAREFLTKRNVPVVRCIICLFSLQEEDEIIKTECLHFFHKQCLGRYITNMQETYQEQKEELLAQNSNVTVNKFQLTCPVCREPIGESRYNLSDLLSAPPPLESEEEPPVYKVSDEMKRLQQKLSKVYLRQQAKGGIIDLEEEGKKMLVVTGGEESSSEFTELSPTDYQLDCVGIPCAPGPASLPTSPKKQQEQGGQGAGQRNGSWQGHTGPGGGGKKGANRGGKGKGAIKGESNNRGKSHHQQKKGKAL